MRNFVRALRHALPYRHRLIGSIVCALLAAVLWGANFTSIYPVLKLLQSGVSPQQWVDRSIASIQEDIDKHQIHIDKLEEEMKQIERLPRSKHTEQKMRDLSQELARVETKLEQQRRMHARY